MRRRHLNYFRRGCQRGLAALGLLLLPALCRAASTDTLRLPPEVTGAAFLKRLSQMHVGGSLSLNWRNIGPRKPGFETQIQDEVYLADMYFGVDGPVIDGIPFQIEMNMPTADQGSMRLNQLSFGYDRVDDLRLRFGKFLVPFGRYNELYRADDFLTVTRPLLFASPDSLDLVVRLNSPRPIVSAGYTDIGARASYYPPSANAYVPDELTFFVVNGLGESTNRQRTFPNTDNLGIQPVPGNGTTIDFGHKNNNLADNNNAKSVGSRVVWALGDVRFPWPIPEGRLDISGVNLGLSAMGGQYDLEANLNYQMYDVDLTFDYEGYNITAEYVYSISQFLAPVSTDAATVFLPVTQLRDFETDYGYFIQASFPLVRKPKFGRRVTGVLVFNQLFRRGPIEDLFNNATVNGTLFPSLNALSPVASRVTTRIHKYTAAVNWQLADHFALKAEYSYWKMGKASTRSVTSLGLVDIYQGAFSIVAGF